MKRFKKGMILAAGAVAPLLGAGVAMAEGWTPVVTLDTAPVTTTATAVVAALCAVWAIRKVIKLMTHS